MDKLKRKNISSNPHSQHTYLSSLNQHSGQKPKNIFVRILVQTKTSLKPFRFLLTFNTLPFLYLTDIYSINLDLLIYLTEVSRKYEKKSTEFFITWFPNSNIYSKVPYCLFFEPWVGFWGLKFFWNI